MLRGCVAALIQLQSLSSPKINTHLNYGAHSIAQISSYRLELIAVFILCTKVKVPFKTIANTFFLMD